MPAVPIAPTPASTAERHAASSTAGRHAPAAPPSATPPAAPAATQPAGSAAATPTIAPAPFSYLWPTYLPPNMRISPSETRVAREGEIAEDGIGFFILTFTDGTAKR